MIICWVFFYRIPALCCAWDGLCLTDKLDCIGGGQLVAERKVVLIGKAIKGWSESLSASATEVCVVSDILPQLSQGNAGCVDLLFVLVFGCASLRPRVLICSAEHT